MEERLGEKYKLGNVLSSFALTITRSNSGPPTSPFLPFSELTCIFKSKWSLFVHSFSRYCVNDV